MSNKDKGQIVEALKGQIQALNNSTPIINQQHTPEQFGKEAQTQDINIGGFVCSSANYQCNQAIKEPDFSFLVPDMWQEQTLCIIFGKAGTGKTIYCTQIANEIAKGQKVAYIDYELSRKQFQQRYNYNGRQFIFNENLFRFEIDNTTDTTANDDDIFCNYFANADKSTDNEIKQIRDIILLTGCKVLFVDNLSCIIGDDREAPQAKAVVKSLLYLIRKYKVSICLVGHSPKGAKYQELDDNHLQGSAMISRLADYVFAVGSSVRDEDERYIKAIKVRHQRTPNKVKVFKLMRDISTGNLYFYFKGEADEELMISKTKADEENRKKTQEAKDRLKADKKTTDQANIIALHNKGLKQREIAKELKLSLKVVNDTIKAYNEELSEGGE